MTTPVNVMYALVWHAKHDILDARTESVLDQIDTQFDLARRFSAGSGA